MPAEPNPLDFRLVTYNSPEYRETVALRFRILREPLGLGFTQEQLAAESSDLHLAAYEGRALAACLVLTPLDADSVKMRQVAVEANRQGQGIGRDLVRCSEEIARERGFSRMVLSARDTAVEFYLRLGYNVVGDPYEEVTILHRKMEKALKSENPSERRVRSEQSDH
jgi:predicted GNAT family N-acyltransferase